MNLKRREFLAGSGALMLSQLPLLRAFAQVPPQTDYKALVCVFLFGGNDGNNTIIPLDSRYAQYAGVRGALAIPQASVVPLAGAPYGLHPDLSALQAIWNNGHLSGLFNVGPLVQPLSKSEYQSKSKPRPDNLFSHSDQQGQWQTAISAGAARSGWGGRAADALAGANGAATLPVLISPAGAQLYTIGATGSGLVIPEAGSFGLNSFGGAQSAVVADAMNQLRQQSEGNQLVTGAQHIVSGAVSNSQALNPILSGSTSSVQNLFAGQSSSIASQLLQVAKLIEARDTLGMKRQIFMVSLGGFDTHTNQLTRQSDLFQQLAPALNSFYDATVQLGVAANVTSFTLSDFARTLSPNSGGGSDHAWGNHQLIIGGAVRGRSFYGAFPALTLDGPDDVGQGRFIPTTAVDQYGATLARWFGVPAGELATVFPNLASFASSNLGFL